jgi:hypothetical protein
MGRRSAGESTRTASAVAMGWFALAVLLVVVIEAPKG